MKANDLVTLARGRWYLDPVILLLALTGVLLGSWVGYHSDVVDIDERLYLVTIQQMQDGEGYYHAFVDAVIDKSGVGPSQVRSIRTPVVSTVLEALPETTWRWVAMLPGFALCLAAAALAGPDLRARRTAAGLTAVWMIVSLPLLFLHQEYWGAAIFAFGLRDLRSPKQGRALGLILAATAIREPFGIGLVVGLIGGRDRRWWVGGLAVALAGALLHAHWAQDVLDPAGFDPPLRAVENYTTYVSPGSTGPAEALGVVLLLLAACGAWLRRHEPVTKWIALATVPLIVATGLSGRSYWSLTWCGITSAAAGIALVDLWDRSPWHRDESLADVEATT